jgi:hypothetical protein
MTDRAKGATRMQRAFVIRPFNEKPDSAKRMIDFERVHGELIGPALKEAGLEGGTTGDIIESGNIREDMFQLIVEADLIVCDITIHNANVFYELGIRHALRRTRTVMIKGQPTADAPPFDLLTDRYMSYPLDDPGKARDALVKVIKGALSSIRSTDSPIFKMLPALQEVEVASVAQVVPTDLIEEVDRAKAAKSKGWLRLLAADVQGRRFQWPALRLIGQAQWDLEDWQGAQRTFESVYGNDEYDVPANLALANIYERQYRKDRNEATMQLSEQAIERVLSRGERATAAQRAEALSLKGRNRKTMWRLGFENVNDLATRRKKATRRTLRESYEAYRAAYLTDLNHYWSGLAALQLGWLALDLAKDKANWNVSFISDAAATHYVEGLTDDVAQTRGAVGLAVEAALRHLPANHKDRVWAEMSPADLSFLFQESEERVISAYEDAAVRASRFAWQAARGQLELFALLGFRAGLVPLIVEAVEALPLKEENGCDHVVVFAGHQIDEPDRPVPRFPAASEPQVRALIRDALEQLRKADATLAVFASAALGADIICHELCRELGIQSTICLPMPSEAYSSTVFGGEDTWRSRFLELARNRPVLQLSSREGLPRWLRDPPEIDPWERGNRWVLEMALASGTKKVSLVTLWDEKDFSGKPGGTGHMVGIARQAGTVNVLPTIKCPMS